MTRRYLTTGHRHDWRSEDASNALVCRDCGARLRAGWYGPHLTPSRKEPRCTRERANSADGRSKART